MAGSERASIWKPRAETQYNDTQQGGKVQLHFLTGKSEAGARLTSCRISEAVPMSAERIPIYLHGFFCMLLNFSSSTALQLSLYVCSSDGNVGDS